MFAHFAYIYVAEITTSLKKSSTKPNKLQELHTALYLNLKRIFFNMLSVFVSLKRWAFNAINGVVCSKKLE